jgi:hypothetical protein
MFRSFSSSLSVMSVYANCYLTLDWEVFMLMEVHFYLPKSLWKIKSLIWTDICQIALGYLYNRNYFGKPFICRRVYGKSDLYLVHIFAKFLWATYTFRVIASYLTFSRLHLHPTYGKMLSCARLED